MSEPDNPEMLIDEPLVKSARAERFTLNKLTCPGNAVDCRITFKAQPGPYTRSGEESSDLASGKPVGGKLGTLIDCEPMVAEPVAFSDNWGAALGKGGFIIEKDTV